VIDTSGEEVWVQTENSDEYVEDPGDPNDNEVWVQTENTDEYIEDPGNPSGDNDG